MKVNWVVRVVLQNGIDQDEALMTSIWIECLRYAGLLRVHRDNNEGVCLDLLPPHGVNQGVWAEQNSQRMQSFSINAVKAPAMP